MTVFQRIALILFAACVASPAAAELAVTINSGTLYSRGTFQNFGWQFSLDGTRSVGALGIFDRQGNGLADEHQVGLWDSSHNLLATVMIGSDDPLTAGTGGGWRFEWIAPLELGPGTYVLGAHYETDADLFIGQASYTLANGVTFLDSRVTVGAIDGFAEPTSSSMFGADGYFGPNLMFVPEPASWAMMIAGFGLIGGSLRIRRLSPAIAAARTSGPRNAVKRPG